jgi:hypothetical protein
MLAWHGYNGKKLKLIRVLCSLNYLLNRLACAIDNRWFFSKLITVNSHENRFFVSLCEEGTNGKAAGVLVM